MSPTPSLTTINFAMGLITIFGRFEFEGAFRAQLRSLRQSGAESVTAYAARTTDLCSRAYTEFATEAQLSLAVDHFIGGLADASTREYLLRERARRPLEWMETVRIAQASESARLSSAPLGAAAVAESRATSSARAPRECTSCADEQSSNQPTQAPAYNRNSNSRRGHSTKAHSREHERAPTNQQGARAINRLSPHEQSEHANVSCTEVPANQSHRAAKSVQSGAAKCFNCGKPGHLAANCAIEPNSVRRCYECGGTGHIARNCANRNAPAQSQPPRQPPPQNRSQSIYTNPKSSNAVASAGAGASQFFSYATIDSIRVPDALVDTGSSFSMMSASLYEQLPSKPRVYAFENTAPDIVGVGGASAAVKGYVDVPLRVADVEVAHPLLVVENLSFALLIGMDILDPHAANISLGGAREVQFKARVCDVCLEPRVPAKHEFFTTPAIACTVEPMSIAANSAVIVRVALPKSARDATSVVLDPLNSSAVNVGCAALPSVCAPLDGFCRVAVVNPSPRSIDIPSGFPIASAKPVIQSPKSPRIAALNPRLPRDAKLRKIVSELKIDSLPDSAPHKSQLLALTARYLDIFAESESDVGVTDLTFHEIDTGDVRPLRQPVRRIPYGEMRAAVEHEVDKLVNADIARASNSPWASPVVMVRKKDGGWRMCVDYRRLNSVTKFDSFPLPRLDEALDAFAGATVFSSLDLAMAYHQVPVKPSDVEKTAFVTHVGLFEMSKMPFGLCNAPSTYQRLMAGVLRGLIGRICLAYLDDVIVFSKKRTSHIADLSAVLDRIRAAGLKLKPSKCALFREQVLYLGHVISAAGVSPDPEKLRVLREWRAPSKVREMQSFLGFINFYAEYLADATELTAQLYDLTSERKGDDPIEMSPENVAAFEEIKRRLCAAPQLAHPDLERPFTLYTDASNIAVGAILLQRDSNGVERPVSFFSKKLSSAQRNYSTFERECLAVICALEHFRVYLLARKFTLRTDHRALAWLFSKEPKASARISGWLATLMEYPVVIEYVKGSENSIADALSRLESSAIDAEVPSDLAKGVPSFACPAAEVDRLDARTDWLAEQRADETISFVIDLLRRGERPSPEDLELNPSLRLYVDVWSQLTLEEDLLKHCNERAVSTRIVVPPPLRESVFRALHEPAHHGYEATLRRIAQRFWWPRVRAEVSAFIRACEVCDRERIPNPAPRAPLGHLPADQPFAALYIDIVGGQNSLSLGASPKSILTMIDGLTGWAEAVPIADQTAVTVARAVYAEWIARYGVPEQLHSDRGVQFESAVFAELCDTFGVDKTRTTPYRPQANGKCERFNRTLVAMLRRAVLKRPYDWEPLLPTVLQAYRSSITESTGFTPFRLAFGREMRLPIDLGSPTPDPPREIRTFAAELAEDLEWSYRVAREVIGLGHRRAESRYNERVVSKQYKPGVLVRVLVHTHPHGVPSKLNAKYSGLCEVIEVRGPTLTLRELDSQRVFTASHDAVRASTLPPRAPQTPAPFANSQPRPSQSADPLVLSPPPAPLDEQRDEQLEIPDDLIDEYEYGTHANANLRELEMSTPNAAPRIPSLLELDMSIPAAFRATQSNSMPPSQPRRNVRAPARYDSSQSFADTAHEADFSDSSARASTPLPNSLQTAAPRRDSHAHLDSIRKKPRAPIRITSAASRESARPAVSIDVIGRRVSWASRASNCCAMSTRKATPPVLTRVCQPQSEENESWRDERLVCDDRRETSVFSFEPRAIAAFARETAAREAHDTVTRNCATLRVRTSLESIGGAHSECTASTRAAHDSADSAAHKIAKPHRNANYSFRLSLANSALHNRRLSRVEQRVPSPAPPPPSRAPIASFTSSAALDLIARTTPTQRSIPLAAVSANSISPPMDPCDAASIFGSAAFGFCDFRAACEVLRSCDETELTIRGLDAQFRREIAATGSNSIRDLLRAHFARLPEMLRALSEFAIIECREAVPALTLTSSGRREVIELCRIRVRSYYAALTVAEIIRREFSARPENEAPQIFVVKYEPIRPAETAPRLPTGHERPEGARVSAAEQPSSASASAPSTLDSSSAPSLEKPAGLTPPDSGAASASTPRPPIAPPRVFGAESAMPPLSFVDPKSIAVAAAAAAALAADNTARREEEIAQGVYSPRPFRKGTPLPFAAPPSRSATAAPTPPTGAPSSSTAPPPPTASSSSAAPPPPTASSSSTAPPPPTASSSSAAPPPPSAAPSSAAPPPAAPVDPDASSKSKRHASKRRPASPLQIRDAKRLAGNGSTAEHPLLVDSPEKPAGEPRSRLSAFEFDEERASRSSTPLLVIAENPPDIESTASKAAESASRCPTPRLHPEKEQELDSPRSPPPSPPAASSSPREFDRTPIPRSASTTSSTPTPYPEYTADDEAAHAPYTSPQFERREGSTATSPPPQSPRSRIESSESSRFAGAWCPPEPAVALPRPPPRSLDPKKDAVAVVVATNTYTLAHSGRQIELVRRVVVQSYEKTIYDRRVEIRAPTLLNALALDRSTRDDIAAPLTSYSEMIRELARHLPNHVCVFHDRAKTLAALRLALPVERSFDLGLHVHLRNDALRSGGRNITRSRHRVIPLEDLWQPILEQRDAESIARARRRDAATLRRHRENDGTDAADAIEKCDAAARVAIAKRGRTRALGFPADRAEGSRS